MIYFFRLLKIFFIILLSALASELFLSNFAPDQVSSFSTSLVTLFRNITGILFFLLVAFSARKPTPDTRTNDTQHPAQQGWWVFFSVVAVIVCTTILVNPRGLYGVKIFPQLANSLKQEKAKFYIQIEEPPDIVILGSSRTLTISPEYIQQTLGYSAFNFGFSGVNNNELALQADLIFQPGIVNPPAVILFEVSPTNLQPLNENDTSEIPLEFLSGMTIRQAASFLTNRYLSVFNIHQFSESIYVLQYVQKQRVPQMYWRVDPDGFSHYYPPDTLDQALARQLRERTDLNPCQYFAKNGDALIRRYAELSSQETVAVVFYFSPIHPVFQQEYLDKSSDYQWCKRIFVDLLTEVSNNNSLVFFVDLSNPETSDLQTDGAGFYDGFHITPASAEKLIDVLAPTIEQAYDLSNVLREDQP